MGEPLEIKSEEVQKTQADPETAERFIEEKRIGEMAMRAFDVLGCRGWGRLDVMVDQQGQVWFLEINTSPGMTDHSLLPMAAKAAGIPFEDLLVKVLEEASAD